MEIIIKADKEAASLTAAGLINNLIKQKPAAVLGLATGETPLRLYQELIKQNQNGSLDFSFVTTFNLDEYVGLSPQHPGSVSRFMHDNLFDHINISAEHTHIPDGLAGDIPAHCRRYEQEILRCGGIDIQVLGIGTDGHIGFNEPTSSLSSRTRIKTLTEETKKEHENRFSQGQVPDHVITMGLATILECRQVVLLAFGEKKAQIVAKMVEGPLTAMVPASALQLHPHVTVLLDEAAASKLERADYYRYISLKKPNWQRFE